MMGLTCSFYDSAYLQYSILQGKYLQIFLSYSEVQEITSG